MKRLLTILVALLFVSTSNQATAQSLLKKIGKAVTNEVINELKNKSNKEQNSQQQSTPTKAVSHTSSQQPAKVSISEVCTNPQIVSENGRGANVIIDGIEYVIHTDKKEACLMCVSKPMRGKTTNVTVWGGIKYKGVVYPVTTIMAHAFEGESLTSVTLSHNLQEIREEAFCYSKLKRVVVHGATKRIGASAFAGTNLESVLLENGIERIESGAFAGCKMLTSVQIPQSVTRLEQRLFEDCTKLTEVILPRTIERIEPYMFCGCTSLTSYSIPSSIVSIGKNAFERSGLKAINIPLNVKTIEDGAFIECQQLERITIPSTVESFGFSVFAFCNKINTVYINVKFKNHQDVANIFGGTSIITNTDLDKCPVLKWTE